MSRRSRGSRWLGQAVAAGLLSATATAVPAQPVEDAAPAAFRPIQTGTSFALRSAILGDTREINVWLPPDHGTSSEPFTVLYLLDGGLGQDFHHIAGLAQLGSLSWTFGPLIVVGVETKQRRAELTPAAIDPRYRRAFPESGGADRFRRFLETEVIPFVERRFRTGRRRALMGESLAGLFVIDTLLNRPSLFHDYVAISPSLWWDDRRGIRRAAARLGRHDWSGQRLYLAMADEGGTMQDGVNLVRSALAALPPDRLSWRYSDRSATATHSTIYHGAAEEALRWLYPAPPYDAGPTPWYMIEGASPPPASDTD